jgi:RimJ/RimL family protein N-acetyltransferase
MNSIFSRIAKRATRAVYENVEYRVYRWQLFSLTGFPNNTQVSRDSFDDLLKFEESERWHDKVALLSDWKRRLDSGAHVYTVSSEHRLLHSGWLRPQITRSNFSEVGQEFKYPPDSAGLWDFYTHPSARGRGLYRSSLQAILNDLSEEGLHHHAYIGVLADNGPSRHVIEKLHAGYQGSFHRRSVAGWRRHWSTFPPNTAGVP